MEAYGHLDLGTIFSTSGTVYSYSVFFFAVVPYCSSLISSSQTSHISGLIALEGVITHSSESRPYGHANLPPSAL